MRYLAGIPLFLSVAWALNSCGSGSGYGDGVSKTPTDTDPAFATASAAIQRNCASCHNGKNQAPFDSGARLKASKAKSKILAGQMPPSGVLPEADKKAILDYIGE